jgi:cell division protein FtsL
MKTTPTKTKPSAIQMSTLHRKVATRKRRSLSETEKAVIVVSLVWLVIGATIVAYIQNGHAQYNKGVFEGMTKTRNILQGK